MMDTDKNGNLTFEELKDGLHMIGQPVADPEVQMLMDAVSLLFIIICRIQASITFYMVLLANDTKFTFLVSF